MLPKEAKKVFSGVIFDVYQWPQKMFDGSIKTFERIKRANSCSIIAVKGDKILLAYEEQPDNKFYTNFCGRQEEGESPLEAAQRELLEESGLVSDDWELYLDQKLSNKIEWRSYVYIARDCKVIQGKNLDAGERSKILECSFEEFIDIVFKDDFRNRDVTVEVGKLLHQNKLDELRQRLF